MKCTNNMLHEFRTQTTKMLWSKYELLRLSATGIPLRGLCMPWLEIILTRVLRIEVPVHLTTPRSLYKPRYYNSFKINLPSSSFPYIKSLLEFYITIHNTKTRIETFLPSNACSPLHCSTP